MKPSAPVCVEAHKLSAWTTIVVTVPMNLYFVYIIYSLYSKVQRGELPLAQPQQPIGRPIAVQRGMPPPMTTYMAKSLNGAPASGKCVSPDVLKQHLVVKKSEDGEYQAQI